MWVSGKHKPVNWLSTGHSAYAVLVSFVVILWLTDLYIKWMALLINVHWKLVKLWTQFLLSMYQTLFPDTHTKRKKSGWLPRGCASQTQRLNSVSITPLSYTSPPLIVILVRYTIKCKVTGVPTTANKHKKLCRTIMLQKTGNLDSSCIKLIGIILTAWPKCPHFLRI